MDDYFAGYLAEYDLVDVAGSMGLSLELQRKGIDVSYTDALGYYLAGRMKIPFLTGDRWFKDLKNVEFVR
jgi:predicted nucleic acid-binding protein